MSRQSKRRRLARGIYRDGHRLEIRVSSHGQPISHYLPGDTPLKSAIAARARLLAAMQTTAPPVGPRGTLATDAARYLDMQTHLASHKNRRAILNHWIALLGHRPRYQITPDEILRARVAWLQVGTKPKTVNHRVAVLRHLYATLDGPYRPPGPADQIAPLPVPKTPIQRVSDETILAVEHELARREREGTFNANGKHGRRLDGAKTRARFRVLVTTGRRPSEIMRAKRTDVDLEARVWVVRDGKGGWSPGLYLNDDMMAAWRLFIEADAWGRYSTSAFANTIRAAGWPANVRPYQARHTTWITAVERGADMADVQIGAGHTSLSTTRQYTGVRGSRMQRLSEQLEGRFGGFSVGTDRGDEA